MKTRTAAVAIAGCLVGPPIFAEQLIDQSMIQGQYPAIDAAGRGTDEDVPVGLFGNYPANRDASGTSWQPDSTPVDHVLGDGLAASGAQFLSIPGNGEFSSYRSNDVFAVRSTFGSGTVGLQSSVSTVPVAGNEAYLTSKQPQLVDVGRGSTDYVRVIGFAASYSLPLSNRSAMFGYVGIPGEPALGPPVSYMRRLSGIDNPEAGRASHWLDSSGNGSRVFTVGYAWRTFKLEGSAFSGRAQGDRTPPEKNAFRLDSTSTRLSYNPSSNWSFQFSRGTLSGLDQLAPTDEVRRLTISATYNRVLTNGNWQSTLAWGRNARKSSEPTMGYLLESTLRFSGTHAVFGRLEQVGSGELVPEGGAGLNRTFKLNKLTFGYFHEIGAHGPVKLDTGAFVSRYAVPASAPAAYAGDPASIMLFVRLNLR